MVKFALRPHFNRPVEPLWTDNLDRWLIGYDRPFLLPLSEQSFPFVKNCFNGRSNSELIGRVEPYEYSFQPDERALNGIVEQEKQLNK